MQRLQLLLALLAVCYAQTGLAEQPASKTTSDDFNRTELGSQWFVNFGQWTPQDGVLMCQELLDDQHAAAARYKVPFTNAEVSCRVKLNEASAFHIGTDPAPKQLNKKGHLYSLIITPNSAMLKSHKDKADETSKDLTIATAKHPFDPGQWIDVTLISSGNTVTVKLKSDQQTIQLQGTHDEFHVKKPALVFRAIKGPAMLDDLSITVLK